MKPSSRARWRAYRCVFSSSHVILYQISDLIALHRSTTPLKSASCTPRISPNRSTSLPRHLPPPPSRKADPSRGASRTFLLSRAPQLSDLLDLPLHLLHSETTLVHRLVLRQQARLQPRQGRARLCHSLTSIVRRERVRTMTICSAQRVLDPGARRCS